MLNGKVVIVVGGSGLIGRAVVKAVAVNRGTVVAASRNFLPSAGEWLKAVPNDLRQRIGHTRVDVTSAESVQSLIDTVSAGHGKFDAIVNCSFPRNENFGRKFEDVTYDDFCDNVNKLLGSCFLVCQKAAAYFVKQGHGNIVNVSSVYGIRAPRFEIYEGTSMTKEVEYIVAKSAIIHLTRYLARYLKGTNIRVNCISPGGVFDNQPEAFVERYNALSLSKGMLSGEDVADALVYLLSDASKYVNGQNLVVDDGFSL